MRRLLGREASGAASSHIPAPNWEADTKRVASRWLMLVSSAVRSNSCIASMCASHLLW